MYSMQHGHSHALSKPEGRWQVIRGGVLCMGPCLGPLFPRRKPLAYHPTLTLPSSNLGPPSEERCHNCRFGQEKQDPSVVGSILNSLSFQSLQSQYMPGPDSPQWGLQGCHSSGWKVQQELYDHITANLHAFESERVLFIFRMGLPAEVRAALTLAESLSL